MKVVALNSTYRKNGSTTRLARSALEGAASRGAETDMVVLADHEVKHCRNCLKCYASESRDIPPCPVQDDVDAILARVTSADGVILATPVHNGFSSASMVAFLERVTWRLCAPTGRLGPLRGVPQPRSPKVRAIATLASAGGMPDRFARFCDPGPWLRETGLNLLNGRWVGGYYAAARLPRQPSSDEDWKRIYFLRRLAPDQLWAAFDLGARVADVAARTDLTPTPMMGWVTQKVLGSVMGLGRLYREVAPDGADAAGDAT
ncbi:MAG: flavodoxin family protein [Deltaproteobacteria bacterium]|nr:flavodoxin family protein [Deltaproteobacteria bacterium]